MSSTNEVLAIAPPLIRQYADLRAEVFRRLTADKTTLIELITSDNVALVERCDPALYGLLPDDQYFPNLSGSIYVDATNLQTVLTGVNTVDEALARFKSANILPAELFSYAVDTVREYLTVTERALDNYLADIDAAGNQRTFQC